MTFSEVATGGVLWKNLFLNISPYSQAGYYENFKNNYFEENLLTVAPDFLKLLQNSGEQLLLYWLFNYVQIIYKQVMSN